MANKRKSKKIDNQSQGSESALLDKSNRDVKKMIKTAKSQGFVTYEQINKVTSSEDLSSEQIEDVLSMLSEMGINVIENEAVVAARLQRWQDGDIGSGSMDNYVPKQKEFIKWCKNMDH